MFFPQKSTWLYIFRQRVDGEKKSSIINQKAKKIMSFAFIQSKKLNFSYKINKKTVLQAAFSPKKILILL
jgi:hypothetical protein